ncbi:TRAP transporter large permease subunit [Providencia hangzhouensis]|uniref:TRAP transporter large permease subunit n=1 Tax=Providencia hangzhouensis TaxID=3031799 RepID=UPI0034DDAB1F
MMTSFSDNPYVFLMIVNAVLLILGMFIEGNAAIIVLVPLLMPTVKLLAIDPIHSGIVMNPQFSYRMFNTPYGNGNVCCHIDYWCTYFRIYREVMPLFFALIIVLLLVTFMPVFTSSFPTKLIR